MHKKSYEETKSDTNMGQQQQKSEREDKRGWNNREKNMNEEREVQKERREA